MKGLVEVGVLRAYISAGWQALVLRQTKKYQQNGFKTLVKMNKEYQIASDHII